MSAAPETTAVNYVPGQFRDVFWTPYEQYANRAGQPFTVLGVAKTAIDEETGNDTGIPELYKIQFVDGAQIDAWGEEVCIAVENRGTQ